MNSLHISANFLCKDGEYIAPFPALYRCLVDPCVHLGHVSARYIPSLVPRGTFPSADFFLSDYRNVSLHKRDEKLPPTLEELIRKGACHLSNCESLDYPQRDLGSFEEMSQYWTSKPYAVGNSGTTESLEVLGDTLSALGLPTKPPPNKGEIWEQDREWEEDDINKAVRTFRDRTHSCRYYHS